MNWMAMGQPAQASGSFMTAFNVASNVAANVNSLWTAPDTRQRCAQFKIGQCRRGSTCKYAHTTNGDVLNNETSSWGLKKVADCAEFARGLCKRGANCKFGHAGIATKILAECGDFKRGNCSRGASCKFSHLDDVAEATRIVCGDWKRGTCNRLECRFAHSLESERTRSRSRNRNVHRNVASSSSPDIQTFI